MGLDFNIYFRGEGDISPEDIFEEAFKTGITYNKKVVFDEDMDAYALYSALRYYGPYYTRGPWELISPELKKLIKAGYEVMYASDACDFDEFEVTPLEHIERIDKLWRDHGEKPYRLVGYKVDYSGYGL